MIRHRVTAAAVILPLVLTAACTSSGHKGSPTGSTGSGSSSTSDGTLLLVSRQVSAAVATLSSAAITIDAGGLIATTTGHLKLSAGKAVSSDFTIGTGSDAVRVITVGDTAVAALPAGENKSGKPYITVRADSSNEIVRGLSGTVPILQAASSLGDLVGLLQKVTNFTVKTPGHYSFDVAGDAKGSALEQQLAELSSKPVPVDLYVNAQNLPVKIVLTVNLGGSALPVTATLSDFNAPVTITAPPANQVATS